MLNLTIPKDILDRMIARARADAPIEACGILAGSNGAVSRLYEMTNTDKSNEHFLMDPAEQFAAIKDMRARGAEMLAVYHSHPETPARPSREDIRLALTPGVTHVIVSLQDPDNPVVKGFLIAEGCPRQIPLEIDARRCDSDAIQTDQTQS